MPLLWSDCGNLLFKLDALSLTQLFMKWLSYDYSQVCKGIRVFFFPMAGVLQRSPLPSISFLIVEQLLVYCRIYSLFIWVLKLGVDTEKPSVQNVAFKQRYFI